MESNTADSHRPLHFCLGSLTGCALLLPIAYSMPTPQHGLTLLCAIYFGVMVGAFSVTFSVPKMFLVVFFGFLGYVFKRVNYPAGPFLLGLVLCNSFETAFRQSMVISANDISIFFTRPLSCTFIILAVLSVVYPIVKGIISDRKEKAKQEND